MKFEDNPILQDIDDNFVAIADAIQDNGKAHEALNECILSLSNRIQDMEEYIVSLPTPDKILYKPYDSPDYLNFKENMDYIYNKIKRLEDIVLGDNN